jgi:glycosyltransferase involved in cell wall biosynthesis
VLSDLKLTGADVVLAPTITLDEFDELRRRWQLLGPACGARWHFVFRRDIPSELGDACPRLRDAFGRCMALDGEPRWRLWTDSDELTARYHEATGRQFGTLPVPHARFSPATARNDGPFRILYLGDARREKGFHHLPALVKSLNGGKPRRFAFSIQAHAASPAPEREIIEAREELRRLSELGVTLFNRPLDPPEYRQLLGSGDLSLLPYDRSAYSARSSGVFAESLAVGIPTIVPADTWMSRRQPAAAGLTYQSLEEVPIQVNEIEGRYHQYKEVADRYAKIWSGRHGARELLLQLGCAAG